MCVCVESSGLYNLPDSDDGAVEQIERVLDVVENAKGEKFENHFE